jgi:hypothetical protein
VPFDPLRRNTPSGRAFQPELTQGALIGGLRLPRYGSSQYCGFLITARCDLAHVKTDTVNLLPIVPLAEWLNFDGCIGIILSRIIALTSQLGEIAESISPNLPPLIGSDWKIGYDLFLANDSSVEPGAKNKYRSRVDELEALNAILRDGSDSPAAISRSRSNCDVTRQLINREQPKRLAALLDNKVLDAHFLPVVRLDEPLREGRGYVILFRQILALPGALLDPLRDGLLSTEQLSPAIRVLADQTLNLPAGLMANVASPHVEHILQRFANVFGRVGVADCSKGYKDWLAHTIFG